MIRNKYKFIALVGIGLFMLMVPPNESMLVSSDFSENNNFNRDKPLGAVEYGDNQLEITDTTNVGAIMNASATYASNFASNQWTQIGTTSRADSPNIVIPMPAQYPTGNRWFLKSGTATVSGMTSTDNFIPNGNSAHFSTADWTYPSAPLTYSDTYWGTTGVQQVKTSTQTYVPQTGYTTSDHIRASTTDFASGTGAGYIQFDRSIREYAFTPTDYPQNEGFGEFVAWQSGGTTSGSQYTNWGYYHNYRDGPWEKQQEGTVGSASNDANYASGKGGSTYDNIGTDTVEVTRNAFWGGSSSSSFYTPTTYRYGMKAYIEGGWDRSSTYITDYNYQFYYGHEGSGPLVLNYTMDCTYFNALANALKTNYQYTNATINFGVTGKVDYIAYTSTNNGGSWTLLNQGPSRDIALNSDGNFDSNQGQLDIFQNNLAPTSYQNMWYRIKARFTLTIRSWGTFYNEALPVYKNDAVAQTTLTSSVSVPLNQLTTGLRIRTDPIIRVWASTPIKEDKTVLVRTTNWIDWNEGIVLGEAGITYSYRINDELLGANGGENGLAVMNMQTILSVRKNGIITNFTQNHDRTFDQLRGINIGLGTGCDRVSFPLTYEMKQALSRANEIMIYVGVRMRAGTEFYRSLNTNLARVYFRNLNFTVVTSPSANRVGLDFKLINGGGGNPPLLRLVDDDYAPISRVEFNSGNWSACGDGSHTGSYGLYWYDAGSSGDAFKFEINNDRRTGFNFEIKLVAGYEYWEIGVKIIVTQTGTYITMNHTVPVPKPTAWGTTFNFGSDVSITDSRFQSYWNDNFNIDFVIPRYIVDSSAYWKLIHIYDPLSPVHAFNDISITNNSNLWTGNSLNNMVFQQTSVASGTVGASSNNGNIQLIRLHNLLYDDYCKHDYTDPGPPLINNGFDNLQLNLLFWCPNDIGTMVLDDNTAFSSPQSVFYPSKTGSDPDSIHVRGNLARSLYKADSYYSYGFQWYYPNNTLTTPAVNQSSASYSGSYSDFTVGATPYTLKATDPLESDYRAHTYYMVSDVCGVHTRTANQPFLKGVYRAGGQYAVFAVKGLSGIVNLKISKTESYISEGSNYANQTLLYNTTKYGNPSEVGNPNQMMNLTLEWKDAAGINYITGGELNISVAHFRFRDPGDNNRIYPTWEISNFTMKDCGNGTYWVLLDPMDMTNDPLTGNVSRGYHEFTISANKFGWDSALLTGNFSIRIDTILEVKTPAHGIMTSLGFHHYDDSSLIAGNEFTIKAKYYINKTTGFEELINNEADNYYAGNVIMAYDLINVWYEENFTHPGGWEYRGKVPMENFLNTTWLEQNPTATGFMAHTGFMQCSIGDGSFSADLNWPKFDESSYVSGKPEYADQLEAPKILEYNISVWVITNRNKTSPLYQPQDLQRQDGEGIKDEDVKIGWPEAVKLREESILIKLNSPQKGNYSRIILTNIPELDGDIYSFNGAPSLINKENYDNSSAYFVDWTSGNYKPVYKPQNYQNNFSYVSPAGAPPNSFRLRTIVNCSLLSSDPGVFLAGMNLAGNLFYPMGPVTPDNRTYGYELDWMGDIEIYLDGWNSSQISLIPDYNNLFYTNITYANGTGTYTVSGPTYYTPWLSWDDIPSTEDLSNGQKKTTIYFQKRGFVGTSQRVDFVIEQAKTTILNASNPSYPSKTYSTDISNQLNISVPWGRSISFKFNYSEITNNILNGQVEGIEGASIRCARSSKSAYENTTVIPNPLSWFYVDEGNGQYSVTLSYLEGTFGLHDMQFDVFRKNYSIGSFTVNLSIVDRRLSIMIIEDSVYSDVYYYHPGAEAPSTWYSPLDMTKIKINYVLIDLDDSNALINVPNVNLKTAMPVTVSGQDNFGDYRIIKKSNVTFSTYYTIEISPSFSGPNTYNANLTTENIANYIYEQTQFEFNITKCYGGVEYFAQYSTLEVPYFQIGSSSLQQPKISKEVIPHYSFIYYDANHTDKLGQRIEYTNSSTFNVVSNFDNPYRTNAHLGSGVSDGLAELLPSGGVDYIAYYIDISNVSTLPDGLGGYLPRYMTVTFQKNFFEDVNYIVNYTITNASTILQSDWSDSKNHVHVRTTSSTVVVNNDLSGTDKYNSLSALNEFLPFSKKIAQGQLVQVYIGYTWADAQVSALQDIKTTNPINPVHFSYSIVSGAELGIVPTVRLTSGEGDSERFVMLYFAATPNTEYATIHFEFTIWRENFDPITYQIAFEIEPRKTVMIFDNYQKDTQYSGKIRWIVRYFDETPVEGLSLLDRYIEEAYLMPYGNPALKVNVDSAGTYIFNDGSDLELNFEFNYLGFGRYEILFDTTALNVRETPYFINMSLGKDTFVPQPVQLNPGLLPSFKILPVQLNMRVWLTYSDEAPSGLSISMITIDPDQNDRFYIWVEIYVNVRNELGDLEEVILKGNLIIQGIIYSANKEEGNDQRQLKELWTFNFTWDQNGQKYKAQIPLKYDQPGLNDSINLAGTNLIRIFAASINSNFDPVEDVAYVTIERGVEVVPTWIWYIVALSVGSVSIVGAAGIRKALQLRIPFILRMIDESIDKISKDKFPTVGIMLGRREFVINKVIDYLDICGIEWAIDDKIESADVEGADEGEEGGSGSGSSGAPMTMQEITVALNKLEHLTPDERALFIDELKRLDRKGQEEFLQSLKEDTK